jgi:hypothetical protein
LHRYLNYSLVVTVHLGMFFGLLFKKTRGVSIDITLFVTLELVFFFGTLGILEFLHRRKGREVEPFNEPDTFISEEEFESLIHKGRKLVILDNLVLDVEKFLDCHPGGRWNLEHNIGKDIAKFFYGGYAIDGNVKPEQSPSHHTHSNFARLAVNQMVIARYCAFD